jgi:hypothetical protein
MEVNGNPIFIRDPQAARLAKLRANKENRTAANAAATTIIEALSDKYGPQIHKDTKTGEARQGKTG